MSEETEIIQPFLLGCDTKSLRVVQISLTALQRLISHQAISEVSDFTFINNRQGKFFIFLFQSATFWFYGQ